jgi:enoyl-CoA hydratase/carnithine racemase
MQNESEILFDRKGVAGIITLNRPGALNAHAQYGADARREA